VAYVLVRHVFDIDAGAIREPPGQVQDEGTSLPAPLPRGRGVAEGRGEVSPISLALYDNIVIIILRLGRE
jgi:hypothetical protein